MPFNDYFEDELAYLRDLGEEFVRANPRLEPFLSPTDPDPDVRRLMEGFAFLTGRLRQKLDDEFPELTHSLLRVLWPHYLRPVPCMSILEFTPVTAALTKVQTIPAGMTVEGRPWGDPPMRCRFRTCFEVAIAPVSLTHVEYAQVGSGGELRLVLAPLAGVALARAGIERVRFYLHADGDTAVGSVLYLWLRRHLSGIEVTAVQGDGRSRVFQLAREQLRPVGFADAEALLPYPPQSFSGYRLLQEYFSLPEKFLFLDLCGLECLRDEVQVERVEVRFRCSRPLDESIRVRPEMVRLHCTPIVNLFAHDADPIAYDHRHREYRVRPQGDQPRFLEVFSVERVSGPVEGSGGQRTFLEFESFAHQPTADGSECPREAAGYYRLRLKPAALGRGVDTYVSFVDRPGSVGLPVEQKVFMDLTCTNRDLAQRLRIGEIDRPGDGAPEFVTFRNISRVSPTLSPLSEPGDGLGLGSAGRVDALTARREAEQRRDARLHWRLISNMALNHLSLADVSALRQILSAYDFRANLDEPGRLAAAARMQGLAAIHEEAVVRFRDGLPVRGRRITLRLRESHFGGPGVRGAAGMYLFASVLNEFFALYASVNSFHELKVIGSERQEEYEWERRLGLQQLL